jgi:murein DD-endopeptidase MepM/ murein hydrolase activator NlpD
LPPLIERALGVLARALHVVRHSAPAHRLAVATSALVVLTAVPALAAGGAGAGEPIITGTKVGSVASAQRTASANDAFTQLQQALQKKQQLDAARKAKAAKVARDKARKAKAAKVRAAKIKKAKALKARAARWVSPTSSGAVSTRFGVRGSMWSSGRHTGIDLKGRTGNAVRNIHTGRVIFAGTDGPYGRLVKVRMSNGDELWYAHLSAISVDVGQKLISGDRIGKVGSTGNTTGPHLHLELHKGGASTASDPLPYLRKKGAL